MGEDVDVDVETNADDGKMRLPKRALVGSRRNEAITPDVLTVVDRPTSVMWPA